VCLLLYLLLIFSHLLFKTFYLHFREQRTHLALKMKQSHLDGRAGRPNEPITSTLCVHGMYFKQRMRKSKSETCIFNRLNRIWCVCVCVCTHTHTHYAFTMNEKWKPYRRVPGVRRFCHHCLIKTKTATSARVLSESEYKTYLPLSSFLDNVF